MEAASRTTRSLRPASKCAYLPWKLCSLLLCSAVLLSAGILSAQDFPSLENHASRPANSTVAYLFPEQISLSAGKSTAVDLHFRVSEGFHINSHTPREKSLVPTNFAAVEQDALKVTAVQFPPGTDYAFAFDPNEKLSVYTGDFVLHAHMTAPAGQYLLQGALRYQACDSRSCFPPRTIPVAIDVTAK